MRKKGPLDLLVQHQLLPQRGLSAMQYGLALSTLELHRPLMIEIDRRGLFKDDNYFVIAEPFFVRGTPWRVLVLAVRGDSLWIVVPWLVRLGVEVTDRFVYWQDGQGHEGFIASRTSIPAPPPARSRTSLASPASAAALPRFAVGSS